MPVSAAITFRMAMGSGYVAVMRGTPVTPHTQYCRMPKLLLACVSAVRKSRWKHWHILWSAIHG
jgi:hypothetical protein